MVAFACKSFERAAAVEEQPYVFLECGTRRARVYLPILAPGEFRLEALNLEYLACQQCGWDPDYLENGRRVIWEWWRSLDRNSQISLLRLSRRLR